MKDPEILKFLTCEDCQGTNMVMCLDCLEDISHCNCNEAYMSLWCENCQTMYERDMSDLEDSHETESETTVDSIVDELDAIEQDTSVALNDVDGVLLVEDIGYHGYFDSQMDVKKLVEDFMEGYDGGSGYSGSPSSSSASSNTTAGKYTYKSSSKGKKNKWGGNTGGGYTQKCRHYSPTSAVEICKGVTIYPSSMNNKRTEKELEAFTPDFGLYADSGWKPEWRNEFVMFPDYGIPSFDVAIEQITSACVRAADLGQKVEIGCIGGHGRTGTMLACMFIWGSYRDGNPITPEQAIAKVRNPETGICHHCIETEEQEWWVSYYAHSEFGSPATLPTMPEKKTTTYGNGAQEACSEVSHAEMKEAGATECLRKGKKCSFWDKDFKPDSNVMERNKDKIKKVEVEKWKKKLAEKNNPSQKQLPLGVSTTGVIKSSKSPSKNPVKVTQTGTVTTKPTNTKAAKPKNKNKHKKRFGKRSK